jgi:hypothetical protein
LLENWRTRNKKFGQVGNNTSRRTLYEMGSRFYKSNQTSKNTNKKQNILVATNYVTKWVEANAFKTNIVIVIIRFMYEYILTIFGCPLTIVISPGVHFINDTTKHLTKQFF